MYDLLIKGGSIIDGTGRRAAFSGDIGISGDQIVEIGQLTSPSRRTIDADGLTVTPGFVDIHTHYDGQAFWDSVLAPSSQHGVTSLVIANCGVGFAPAKASQHETLIRLLEGVEDIPGDALKAGVEWGWETFPEFLDALDRRHHSVDIGAYVPHAPLRIYVMGDRGADPAQHPSDQEIGQIEDLVYEAIQAGALGFSTSRVNAHRTSDGKPIGTLKATVSELEAAARALARAGRGSTQVSAQVFISGPEDMIQPELQTFRRILEVSGRPLSISLLQSPSNPDRWRQMLDWIEETANQGLDIRAQVATRAVGAIIGLTGALHPFCLCETYLKLASLPIAERSREMSRRDVKSGILAEYRALAFNNDDAFQHSISDLDGFYRMNDPVDYEPDPKNSVAAEARRRNREPIEFIYDVLLEEGGRRLLYGPNLNYGNGNLDVAYELMKSKRSLFSLSDGGAHVLSVSDASCPTTAFALWTRGTRSGKSFSPEMLVHGFTQRNAAYLGWNDRGVIAPGFLADLNILSLGSLDVPPPYQVTDLPGGCSRFMQEARGYHWTIKSGEVTFEDGIWTEKIPGRLVRGERHRPH